MADGLLNKASIILTPTGYKAGTLYNVAPVVEPYEDFDFSRASVASRVNSSGLVEMVGRTLGSELITNGDFTTSGIPDTSSYTLGWYSNTDGVEIANGKLTLANDASGAANAYATDGVSSLNILTTNKIYKLTFDITDNTNCLSFQIYQNAGSFVSVTNTVGSYTYYITNTSNSLFLFRNNTVNSSISLDNVSVKEIIDTNNIPRISYDSNGDNGHILLEPTSTNLVPYSEDFSQSAWQKSNITLTPNSITSPDGNLNAYKLTKPTSSQPRLFELSVYPTIGIHTFTSFYKNLDGDSVLIRLDANGNTANCNVDLTTNTLVNSGANIISSNITQLSDGWIRVSVTANILSTSWVLDAANLFSLSVGSSVYIWGAQLEELSYSTSYIPTLTGSTVTRAAETATGAGSADLINSTEGVLYAEIAAFEVEPDFFISMNDGTQNNRVIIKFSEAIDNQLTAFTINSTNFSSITHTISDFTQYNKIALSYNSSYLKLFVNGQEVGTSVANPNLAVGLNVLNLSNLPTDKNVKGKVKALAVFNEALSDSELTQLTT